ncbi:hypothetical protein [Pseudoalteromonas spongiae]|uniref:hypothetical protein n=1 Tax=Pseudoalteromonas spongiae TaxID=298657 RepID=UPI000C2D5905|nr:hypothetical protein [Pseudoalteromonas spongiae]
MKLNSEEVSSANKSVAFIDIVKKCLLPAGMSISLLVLGIYTYAEIVNNLDFIDAFFTLSPQQLNAFLTVGYINLFFLSLAFIAFVKFRHISTKKPWKIITCSFYLIHILLIAVYCNSYWSHESMTLFQKGLSTFLWLPVWVTVVAIFVLIVIIVDEVKGKA